MFGLSTPEAIMGGSVIGGLGSFLGQQSANRTNEMLADEANAFSAQQFATRYQTTVNDLKAAGLNPMLAYGQGGGSPPSAVPIATQQNALHGAADTVGKAVGAANVAMQTDLTDAQITESISRTGVNDEQRKNLSADTYLKILEAPNVSQKTKNMVSEMLLNDARRTATGAEETAKRLDTAIRTKEDLPRAKAVEREYGRFIDPTIQKRIETGVNSATNAAGAIKGTKYLPNQTNYGRQ